MESRPPIILTGLSHRLRGHRIGVDVFHYRMWGRECQPPRWVASCSCGESWTWWQGWWM